jgi:hypothetical protein
MNDISEIVERLRVFIGGDLGTKAADKIETLLDERDMMQDAVISRDMTIDALRAELATLKQSQEPVAWETDKGNGLIRYVTDAKYQKFDITIKGWYRPYTSAQTIPAGWQLVPVEPTHQMIEAGNDGFRNPDSRRHTVSSCYKSMLSAAPKPGEPA